MEKSSESNAIRSFLISMMLFFATGIITAIAAWLYGKSLIEILRLVIISMVGSGIVLFMSEAFREKEQLLYDNAEHYGRFVLLYFVSLICAVLFPLLPVSGWPYLVLFVFLAFLSNQVIGIGTGTVFLMISVLLEEDGSYNEFFMYFIVGIAGIALFLYVDETFKVGVPLLISSLLLLVSLSANEVMFRSEALSIELFLIPCINIFVCLLVFLVMLKYVSYSIIHKNNERYMEINDPECPLLAQLKENSKEEYYHAIHTAYLSDRIAKRLLLDEAATKSAGYYHRIGMIKGKNNWSNVEQICMEYQFPPKVCTILEEYLNKEKYIRSKETVVVLFADTIVSSILYLFSKDVSATLDYQKLIDAVFKKKMESGIIDQSDISIAELNEMKKIFLEEKLYYDFLR